MRPIEKKSTSRVDTNEMTLMDVLPDDVLHIYMTSV